MQGTQSKGAEKLTAMGWRRAGEGDSSRHQTPLQIAMTPFMEECILKDKKVKKQFLLFPSKSIPLVLSQ